MGNESKSQKRLFLEKSQALSLLPEGEQIHTFRSEPGMLVGADWDRCDIKDAIAKGTCEIGSDAWRWMNHGLVVFTGAEPLFVQTADDIDWPAEEAEAEFRMSAQQN